MSRVTGPLAALFVDANSKVQLALTNTTGETLRSVEVLTVFLKDDVTPGAASRVHIKFDVLKSLQPHGEAFLSHRTWIDGKPVGHDRDQLERLKVVVGQATPYVLDISWENGEGKSRFQRIPVGH